MADNGWRPPLKVSREQIVKESEEILALPDIAFRETEDVFRIKEMGLDWDIGVRLYEPEDPKRVPSGPDGKKIGIFMLHGGQDDWRQLDPMARFLVIKFGYKVMTGTFPGRLYLQDKSRDWPGDTIHPDGSVRTPIWLKDELIGRDEYDVVYDDALKWRYGVATLARAKPGTNFYYRMAAWPTVMEMGFIEANRRHFPAATYSVYGQGHSTGGPNISMLSQRIPNFVGALAAEHSAHGFIAEEKWRWRKRGGGNAFDKAAKDEPWRKDNFNDLVVRTWRDIARYHGPETLAKEGPNALMRLPSLMEEVFERWQKDLNRPRFKCEYMLTHNVQPALKEAALVTAKRLQMNADETAALVKRYSLYPYALEGEGVKPVPPFLFGIALNSRDHTLENYLEVNLPCFARFNPPAKATVTQFQAGVHLLWRPEEQLPYGILPSVVKSWKTAIDEGFFLT
jgi:hypothetical protein